MRAELKVPGGKLVTVELEVAEALASADTASIAEQSKHSPFRISAAKLAGDFFIEPDEALGVIEEALSCHPADSTAAVFSAAIEEALIRAFGNDWKLIGFRIEDITRVVMRALGTEQGEIVPASEIPATTTPDWRSLEWEIIRHEPLPAAVQVALDQVLTEAVADGTRGPTLRIWEWEASAIIIGSFQSVKNEVDVEAAAAENLQIIRRITGGGSMLMEAGTVITYSFYIPVSFVAGMSFEQSYQFLDSWVIDALRRLGVDAEYKPLNDIASPQGKIGGAAQKRLAKGAMLHHATIAYEIDGEKMLRVLRIGREKLSDKGIKSAAKRVDPLSKQLGKSREDIVASFEQGFTELTGAKSGKITAEELEKAEALAVSKFTDAEWTYRIP